MAICSNLLNLIGILIIYATCFCVYDAKTDKVQGANEDAAESPTVLFCEYENLRETY